MSTDLLKKFIDNLSWDLYNLERDIIKQLKGLENLRISTIILGNTIYKGYAIPKLCMKFIYTDKTTKRKYISTIFIIKEFSVSGREIFRTVSINGVINRKKWYTREQILDYALKVVLSEIP